MTHLQTRTNVSAFFLVPDNTSPVLRQFVAALFITHGETKLNSIGNLLDDSNMSPPFLHGPFRGNWCHGLIHPAQSSSIMTITATATATTRQH